MDLKIAIFLIAQIFLVIGRCIHNKYAIIVGHTACISRSPSAEIFGEMTIEIKNEIVNLHNTLRARVNAVNMQKVVWDDELAVLAQKWSDNCEFKHDGSQQRSIPGRFSVGQNLGIGHQSWSAALNSWWNEIDSFHYNQKNRMSFGDVGHFTQMAWADTARIGCGWTTCTNLQRRFFQGRYFVCNYGKAGNQGWEIPYNVTNVRGNRASCSSCPNTCNRDGLCDCGGKVCGNGGKLDVNTCQCTCVKPYHTPDICGLDCEAAVDSRHCGRIWQRDHCDRFLNVPKECPHMCGLCPSADYRLQPLTTPSERTTTTQPSTTTRKVTTQQTTTARAVTTNPRQTTTRATERTSIATARTTIASARTSIATARTSTATASTAESETPTSTDINVQLTDTTEEAVDIKIEEKGGKTIITIPHKMSGSRNGTARVIQQPDAPAGVIKRTKSSLYSTLVYIFQLP